MVTYQDLSKKTPVSFVNVSPMKSFRLLFTARISQKNDRLIAQFIEIQRLQSDRPLCTHL